MAKQGFLMLGYGLFLGFELLVCQIRLMGIFAFLFVFGALFFQLQQLLLRQKQLANIIIKCYNGQLFGLLG